MEVRSTTQDDTSTTASLAAGERARVNDAGSRNRSWRNGPDAREEKGGAGTEHGCDVTSAQSREAGRGREGVSLAVREKGEAACHAGHGSGRLCLQPAAPTRGIVHVKVAGEVEIIVMKVSGHPKRHFEPGTTRARQPRIRKNLRNTSARYTKPTGDLGAAVTAIKHLDSLSGGQHVAIQPATAMRGQMPVDGGPGDAQRRCYVDRLEPTAAEINDARPQCGKVIWERPTHQRTQSVRRSPSADRRAGGVL